MVSSFRSASRSPSRPCPVRQDSSRYGGSSRPGPGCPGWSRSDLFSSSRSLGPCPLGLCVLAGPTTVSRKSQLEGEARSEASNTARMRSACSSLQVQEANR